MSGYDSISDYAFNKFDIKKYSDYETWLIDLENDFLKNGRSPLDEIFDDQDYIDLENEWNKRKDIIFIPPPPPEPPKKKGIIQKTISRILGFFGL
jgi:hypothetical protein